MSYELRIQDWKEKVLYASINTVSAAKAAEYLGIKYDTYKLYAIKYGCLNTNQSGKGTNKDNFSKSIPLEEIIFDCIHPQYQSNKLRKRLIAEGIFNHICSTCKLETWLEEPIPLELDHIDGNSTNHSILNLRLLCPNCHAFTPTYRGKNINK